MDCACFPVSIFTNTKSDALDVENSNNGTSPIFLSGESDPEITEFKTVVVDRLDGSNRSVTTLYPYEISIKNGLKVLKSCSPYKVKHAPETSADYLNIMDRLKSKSSE